MTIDNPDLEHEAREALRANSEGAEAYRREAGGMPEITRASDDLMTAIQATREEIEDADFASRFQRPLTDLEATFLLGRGGSVSPMTMLMIEDEGRAGLERSHLLNRLMRIEGSLHGLIHELVGIRAHLAVSCDEFETPPASEAS